MHTQVTIINYLSIIILQGSTSVLQIIKKKIKSIIWFIVFDK